MRRVPNEETLFPIIVCVVVEMMQPETNQL